MTIKTKINKTSIQSITFKTELGVIASYLGNMLIVNGYQSLENCKIATQSWIARNEGLQIQYDQQ